MLAHLTCVSSSKETIRQRIEDMRAAGIKNVMALRGDLTPELIANGRDNCDYHYAVELIRELKDADADFCIGAACYPEKHPESANQAEDIKHLKEKVDAGADFLTTQMVFDNNLFFSFLYKLRDAGVNCPVLPGIMPITNANQVERAIKLSGSFMPQRFKSLVDKFGSDRARFNLGVTYLNDGKVERAEKAFKEVKTEDADLLNAQGAVAMAKGDYKTASSLFKKSGTSSAKNNQAVVDILTGNYEAAAAALDGQTGFNAALAQLLVNKVDKADKALTCNCARSNYLRAIIAARKGDASGVSKYLDIAKENKTFAERAEKDVEFAQYR